MPLNTSEKMTIDPSGNAYVSSVKAGGDEFQATVTSANATSATEVKAAVAGKQIHITSLIISTDTATNIQLQDDTGTPVVLMEGVYLAANGGMTANFPPECPLSTTAGQALDVIAADAGNISVTVTGYVI